MHHESVLLNEFLKLATEVKPLTMWDATLGLAGHSIALAKALPSLKVYGSDVDSEMLAKAQEKIKFEGLENRFFLKKANFSEDPFVKEAPFGVILLDLGMSSLHLENFNRGFSFRKIEILDMRFDTTMGEPLWQWLNRASGLEIAKILKEYGEEPLANAIAQEILNYRKNKNLKMTSELVQIVEKVYRKKNIRKNRHVHRYPATRAFQAFRIFQNQELAHLEKALGFLPERLEKGGRLFIISFHSLEDRLVKKTFRQKALKQNKNFVLQDFKEISRKPIVPSEEEIEKNPRSRSAKMRVLERCL